MGSRSQAPGGGGTGGKALRSSWALAIFKGRNQHFEAPFLFLIFYYIFFLLLFIFFSAVCDIFLGAALPWISKPWLGHRSYRVRGNSINNPDNMPLPVGVKGHVWLEFIQ